jgi:ribonuclease HI
MSDTMKILYAIAALTLLSTSAQAWQVVERCTDSKYYGKVCTTSYLDDPVRNTTQEQEDEKARRASIEKWEAFCKPKRTYDDEGVVRLVYARKGCEFGRSE